MTVDEATQCYYYERSRYYSYCSDINRLQNQIAQYRYERHNKAVLADNKRLEIQRNQGLIDSICNTSSSKDGLFAHLANINGKVEDAANNFSTMVCSSAVTAMNLGNSYGEKATKANSKLTEVFEQIGSAKANVQGVVSVLQNELNAVNGRIQELDTAIMRAQNEMSDYEYRKQRCLANMAYYKKFMGP